eukprot:15752109-Heterocapsa_arctica.AAC.1
MKEEKVEKIDGEEILVLVDSGAYAHVCPKAFANDTPMRKSTSGREALTADGRPLRRWGERD